MKRMMLLGAVVLVLNGCAWVKLSPEGERTRVLGADEVSNCTKVGFTTSTLRATVAGFHRNDDKVRSELEMLARNSAPDLGGDAVVPVTEPENGRQTFDVYRCVNR